MTYNANKLKSFFITYIVPLILFLGITFVINPNLFTGFATQIEKNDGRLLAWTVSWDIHKLLTDPFGIYNANISLDLLILTLKPPLVLCTVNTAISERASAIYPKKLIFSCHRSFVTFNHGRTTPPK